MARNFPVHLNSEGEEITIISGLSTDPAGNSYNLARGYLQTIEFIDKCLGSHETHG